jgi:Flavin-binding monooxygenase-like
VLPKHLFGRPIDVANQPFSRLPLPVRRVVAGASLRLARGTIRGYGLPEPDHRLYAAHPTLSSRLLTALRAGQVQVKPRIERFDGDRVRFVDGTQVEADVVVLCTGYQVSFPFLGAGLAPGPDLPLFRRVVDPTVPGLFYIGLLQPQGSVFPLAERQAVWVAELVTGRARLPGAERMRAAVSVERERSRRRFVEAPRHLLEVDVRDYLRGFDERRRTSDGSSRFLRQGWFKRAQRTAP